MFYSDPVETYLISKTIAKTNFAIPLTRKKQKKDEEEYEYKGSEDVRESLYGAKWNKKWLDKCTGNESIYENAKAVAYLCDPYNWIEYKENIANYAVGGPTLELLIKSWNKSQGQSVVLLDSQVTTLGTINTIPTELREGKPLNPNIKKNVYSIQNSSYWLSSPGNVTEQQVRDINGSSNKYCVGGDIYTKTNHGVRPIVSIPTSKISVNGDTVTVNP